ncbi:MAG: dihydroxy-acid dehydratase, partial [Alphaproteobacteria bacterium]|nr:dihydroxy-acid dehydratase [Alphaproteobacteria bacterium]
NAIIHLVAMAGRAGIQLPLERFDAISRRTPLLCNLRPSGSYLMEDFFYAGGLRALMAEIQDLLALDCRTVAGVSLGETLAGAAIWNDDVIRRRDNPLKPDGGLAILTGNLAPNGAVIKHAAAEARLHAHTGPAVAFEDYNDMARRIDDPDLPVTADSVLVLKRGGPTGGPGMPEWGMLPIPQKLLRQGVRDMVRISDARMSGTSYGACILHVAPEAAIGGPIALVQDGDPITLNVAERRLSLDVPEAELARRRANWQPRPAHYERGYGKVYLDQVTQADQGCDWVDLHHGTAIPEPEIH